MSEKVSVEWTRFELAAIAKGLALLQERIDTGALAEHEPAVATAHDKLLALASRHELLEVKA